MAWTLNGVYIESSPCKLPAIILEMFPDFQFWSEDALQKLYCGIMELSLVMAKKEQMRKKGGQRAVITRYINKINSAQKIPNDRTALLKMLYEKILVAEGYSRLHGFGFTDKWGDIIQGNSEYESIRFKTYHKQNLQLQQKRKEKNMKRSQLAKAAKELNETLGLDPEIDPMEKPKVLSTLLVEAAELIDPELDEITDETMSVINTLIKESNEFENNNEVCEEESVEEESVEEESDMDLLTLINKTKKLADLKILVNTHDEFEKFREELDDYSGLGGLRELKAAMLTVLRTEKDTKDEKIENKKNPKARKVNERASFLFSLFEEGKYTRKEIIEKGLQKFPYSSKSAWGTLITDSKNPKYNKFDRLVEQKEDGTLAFKD